MQFSGETAYSFLNSRKTPIHYSSASGNWETAGWQLSAAACAMQDILCHGSLHRLCPASLMKIAYLLPVRRIFIMKQREVKNWQDEEALKRFQMISPLLDETLDQAKKQEIRRKIADDNDVSIRTIRRYEYAFRQEGFSGLKPQDRKGYATSLLPENFPELVQEAIILKKEVPTRSVNQIIYILEGEQKVPEGVLKRSTLQRYLYNAGFGEAQMKKYREDQKSVNAAKRFCKPHRMMLVQADIKYGVGILIRSNGKKSTAYLSSIIDDHSRYLLASEWYEEQDEYAVTDVFRKAILKFGRFDKCYTDNGSVYISHQLTTSCASLGIRLIRAKPFSGKSKGKIEKFHQIVDSFIAEIKLKKIDSLSEINRLWAIFLDGYYHKKPHQGIREYYQTLNRPVPPEGISPEQEWKRDSRQLTYIDRDVVARAFMYHEYRKVDRGGLISFKGRKYEAGASLIGARVEISYDPKEDTEIYIGYDGITPFKTKPIRIPEYCAPDPVIPESMSELEPAGSRLLDVIEKKYGESQQKLADAISYSSYGKDGE